MYATFTNILVRFFICLFIYLFIYIYIYFFLNSFAVGPERGDHRSRLKPNVPGCAQDRPQPQPGRGTQDKGVLHAVVYFLLQPASHRVHHDDVQGLRADVHQERPVLGRRRVAVVRLQLLGEDVLGRPRRQDFLQGERGGAVVSRTRLYRIMLRGMKTFHKNEVSVNTTFFMKAKLS